jgi:hypothetical protein
MYAHPSNVVVPFSGTLVYFSFRPVLSRYRGAMPTAVRAEPR